MKEVKSFKQSELVLRVRTVCDTTKIDLDAWLPFIRRLCSNRPYQEEAIRLAILYLAAGNYGSLSDLARENFRANTCLQEKYLSLDDFLNSLQMRDKLYATIDLATGTGKSYVMYGIAQIALGLGLVDRVLVLCPSLVF